MTDEQKRQVYLLVGLIALLGIVLVFQINRIRNLSQQEDYLTQFEEAEQTIYLGVDEKKPVTVTGARILDMVRLPDGGGGTLGFMLLAMHELENPERNHLLFVNSQFPGDYIPLEFLDAREVMEGTVVVEFRDAFLGLLSWKDGDTEKLAVPSGYGAAFSFDRATINPRTLQRQWPKVDYLTFPIADPDPLPAAEAANREILSPTGLVPFLTPSDRVIGVAEGNEAVAYPVRMLRVHQVLSDTVGGQAFTLLYSPFCGAAVAFAREPGAKTAPVGFSGLIHNGVEAVYDKESFSLWGLIDGRAFAGPRTDDTLPLRPVVQTTWAAWQAMHPDTRLLSPADTPGATRLEPEYGFDPRTAMPARSATGPILVNYFENEALFYPIIREATGGTLAANMNRLDPRVHNKAWVIGLRADAGPIAYPIGELARTKQDTMEIAFQGRTVTLHFDAQSGTGFAAEADGRPLAEATLTMWYAWFAAYPETDVWLYGRE